MHLFTRRAYAYHEGGRAGEYDQVAVPDAARAEFDRYREGLVEAIAGMKEAMTRGDLYPLFAVSAERMIGVCALLAELVQLMPSAYEMEERHALR